MAQLCYAKCRYAKCRYAKRRYAKCRGPLKYCSKYHHYQFLNLRGLKLPWGAELNISRR